MTLQHLKRLLLVFIQNRQREIMYVLTNKIQKVEQSGKVQNATLIHCKINRFGLYLDIYKNIMVFNRNETKKTIG